MNELGKENFGTNSYNLCFMRHKSKTKSKSLFSLINSITLPKKYFSDKLLVVRVH